MSDFFWFSDYFYDDVKRLNYMQAYIKRIRNNVVLFSYETPVIIKIGDTWYEEEMFYSNTTAKHKTTFKNKNGITTKLLHPKKFNEKIQKFITPKLTENFHRKVESL